MPLVLLALMAALLPPITAHAGPVRCGTVVDETAVLDRDLRCDGPGVVLRNPRSVLHLNGHVIESARTCAEGAAPSGIVVEATADGAQILGPGIVRGFTAGIAIAGAARVQVRELRVAESCDVGLLVVGADGIRVREMVLDRNGVASDDGGAVRVEQTSRFLLDGCLVAANRTGGKGAAVDLRDCDQCRLVANRIVSNAGPGLRLDPESRAAVIERNLVIDHRTADIVDYGNDGTYALNAFERGEGIRPPDIWPALGPPTSVPAVPAGCGLMHVPVPPQGTAEIVCPATGGARAIRNGPVAYRLLNPLSLQPFGACEPAEVRSAGAETGGAVRCTNPNRLYTALLEVTCCLQ